MSSKVAALSKLEEALSIPRRVARTLNHPKDRYQAIWYLVSALTHQNVRWLAVMVMLVQTKKRGEETGLLTMR